MNILDEIRETINTLVKIANGENVQLTQRQAYLAVRVMDLTEGFISGIDFSDAKWQKYKPKKNGIISYIWELCGKPKQSDISKELM